MARPPFTGPVPPTAAPPAPSRPDETPSLFDDLPAPARDLVDAVLASPTFAEQRRRHARVRTSEQVVATVLRRLLTAPGHRLDDESVAAAVGVAKVQLPGALSQLQRLLNVEQYPVLSLDADGRTVVLDADLLREQFGVPA